MLEDAERLDLVAIDDIDSVIGRRRWEEGFSMPSTACVMPASAWWYRQGLRRVSYR